MKISFGLILIVLTTFLISCNRTPDLTKDEVYKILNEIIADDSLRLYTICWQVDNLTVIDEYGFSSQDKKFIERQSEVFKDFKFETNRLKYYSGKQKKINFIHIDTTCKVGILNRLSFPLISVDRKRVVIENTEDCHCVLGGQGGKDLYIKQNGHWKREKSFDRWISENTNPTLNERIAQHPLLNHFPETTRLYDSIASISASESWGKGSMGVCFHLRNSAFAYSSFAITAWAFFMYS